MEKKRFLRPAIFLRPALALSMVGLVGCANGSDPDDVTVNTGALTAVPAASVLGFETPAGWKVSSGTVASSANAFTQGTAALAVTAPQNYTTLVSAPLPSGLAPLAGLTNAGATVEVDLQLPTSQPSPSYLGALQMYVSAPSRGVNNQYLGQVELTGKQLGTFQTYQFAVTSFVMSKLVGATYADLTFTIALSAPAGAKGTYLFDNLRTTSPATAQVGSSPSVDLTAQLTQSPLVSTPGSATFATGTIQVPQSFHVKTGAAGTGTALFELGLGTTTTVSCTYKASSDGTSYLFGSCTTGNVAGDIVSANFARLTLKAASPTAPLTKVRAQLAENALGDQVGSNLVPPIPTYWGTTLPEINAISLAFTQLQINNPPPVQRFVSLPIPDFAQSTGNGAPLNALDGSTPRPVGDPPFDFKGDLNNSATGAPSGTWDAYYELAGSISSTETNQDFTSHFDATATVGVVVLGTTMPVLSATATVDTDNGGTNAQGSVQPTSTATFQAFVFGDQFESDTWSQQTGFDFTESDTKTIDTPPIQIWIFSVQGGIKATAGIHVNGSLAINGFQVTATPEGSVGVHVFGGISVVVASGGVDVTVQLIDVSIPTVAKATFGVNTDPTVCKVTFDGSVDGSVVLTSLGGSIDLEGTLGPCPFCVTDSVNIFHWKGRNLGTIPFPSPFPIQIPGDITMLPHSVCAAPVTVVISSPAANASVPASVPVSAAASATRPPTSQDISCTKGQCLGLPEQVDCSGLTWTSSDPKATFSPSATGCAPFVTFSSDAAGTTQILTANAVDRFGETGTASVRVNVGPPPTGPIPFITSQSGGVFNASNTTEATMTGTVSGGTGTVTLVWNAVPVAPTTAAPQTFTQTLTASPSAVAVTPFVIDDLHQGTFTVTLTATDSNGASNVTTPVTVNISPPPV
jgi:hypothetical protein